MGTYYVDKWTTIFVKSCLNNSTVCAQLILIIPSKPSPLSFPHRHNYCSPCNVIISCATFQAVFCQNWQHWMGCGFLWGVMSPPCLLKLKYLHLLSKRCILYSFQAAEKIRAAEEIPLPKIQTFVPFSCTEAVNLFFYHMRGKITECWLAETEGIFS